MSSDLDDTLRLFLQTGPRNGDPSMDDSASDSSSPPDWAQLSTLWDGRDPNGSLKYPELMDFNDPLPMDMDFDPTMGLDPNAALHYDSLKYTYDPASTFQHMPADLLPPDFAFTFQNAMHASASSLSSGASSSGSSADGKQRRLSVTSSSFSSGTSVSPPAEDSSPSPPSDDIKHPLDDLATELAARVRQAAGIVLAVPMSAQFQTLTQSLDTAQPNNSNSSKMPIPRLPRHTVSSPQSTSSSAASTPPPATPPMSKLSITKPVSISSASSSALLTPTTAMDPLGSSSIPTSGGRPKTSHTTIERRYRTNLNARIQSLRMAVPALRVLEDRDGGNGKKIKKNLKDGVYLKGAGIGIDGEDGTVDVIDERGFVDGVKVARKCSKANVLGKAVEYIRVLKKREIRLKAEYNGLKALLCGLMGGPALLKEWEVRWRERFGGEEKDEVEGEEAEDFDSDDEDGEDGDEEVGKKRKRAKTSTSGVAFKKAVEKKATMGAVSPSVANVITQLGGTAPGVAPEKRKRGRPRKIPAQPTPIGTLAPQPPQDVTVQHDQIMLAPNVDQHQQQPQQYLLAVFALFSFFNSPLTSSYGFSSGSQQQQQHTGVLLNPPLALAPEIISQFMPVPPPVESTRLFLVSGWTWRECMQSFHLFVSILVLACFVCSWMGLSLRRRTRSSRNTGGTPLMRNADGKVDWVAVCHDTAAAATTTKPLSVISQARMYASLLSAKRPLVAEMTSMALVLSRKGGGVVLGGVARAKARSLWARAKMQSEVSSLSSAVPAAGKRFGDVVKLGEKLVLKSLDVEEAVKQLESEEAVKVMKERRDDDGRDKAHTTPIEILACVLVRQRVKQHLVQLFVDAVGGVMEEGCDEGAAASAIIVEGEMRRTIDAARELGGEVEELGRTLERVWKSSLFDDVPAPAMEGTTTLEVEIKALLTALVLYRRLFRGPAAVSVTSALLSPPPSPPSHSRSSSKGGSGNVLLDLRRALGNRVFEDGEGEMEVARDRVVDMIVDMERRRL